MSLYAKLEYQNLQVYANIFGLSKEYMTFVSLETIYKTMYKKIGLPLR
jgi:hypothetical protein